MKLTKSTLTVAGSLSIAIVSLSLLMPRTVHALAATLVQITNTSTNPVVNQDVDSPGRSPYAWSASCYSASISVCHTVLPAVPANKRLVIQFLSANIDAGTTVTSAQLFDGTNSISIVLTAQGTDAGGYPLAAASQPMLDFVDAGQAPGFTMVAKNGPTTFMNGYVTVTGYLIDLPANP